MEVAGKCVLCGATIPLTPDDDLRIECDDCKAEAIRAGESV
jgi:DNA-directed RNA polymerase subunit RPC12/RpoP